MIRRKSGLLANTQGQGLTEYLILVLLVAVISIGAVKTLGETVKKKLQLVRKHIHEKVDLEASR